MGRHLVRHLVPFQDMGEGIDIETGGIVNMMELGVVEPLRVVRQAIQSATEVAIAILRIDDIIGKRGEPTGENP